MHDIKFIKENKTFFEESMKKRNIKISANKIVEIYNSYLDFLNKVQKYQEKKKYFIKENFYKF